MPIEMCRRRGAGGYFLDWSDGDPEATEAKDVFSRMRLVDDVFELRCVLLTLAAAGN